MAIIRINAVGINKEMITPVQLIVGEFDAKFVSINQTMNKEIPNSELAIIEGAGHRVHLEKSVEVAQILNHFITKNTLP